MRSCISVAALVVSIMVGATSLSTLVMAQSLTKENVEPSIEKGASVYHDRCILCHGAKAMGDGLIPLKIENYPNTNLMKKLPKLSAADIREATTFGGTTGKYSIYMPPMGDELSWTEMESVIQYISLLKADYSHAMALVAEEKKTQPVSLRLGSQLFSAQCVLCHGKFGDGTGRMSRIIKTPPPANLVVSRLPDSYLRQIIQEGGQSVGRSAQMPAWKDQFSKTELDSLILYIKSIRR